jgi:hypothetical protein
MAKPSKQRPNIGFADRADALRLAEACQRADPGWQYRPALTGRGWVVEIWSDGRFLGELGDDR